MKRGFLMILCLLSLTACGAKSAERKNLSFFAMDTLMDFSAYADERTLEGARDVVMDIERRVSVTDEGSDIYKVNRDGGGRVSEETAALVDTALSLGRLTGGAFDVSIYPVVRAWGFTTGDYRVPTFDETSALLESVDYSRVRLDGTQIALPDGMEIDLGGIAKGYAGREAANYLRGRGITSALLNLGGNVQTVGSKPDGSAWRVAVQDPQNDGYAGILEVVDKAAVTSGGYQRYFEGADGQIYWHIMDPETGRPARNGLISATVVADDGALCDALSTALFVMGPEKAERFWRGRGDFEMVLITEDGEALVTSGLSYEPQEGAPYEVRILER